MTETSFLRLVRAVVYFIVVIGMIRAVNVMSRDMKRVMGNLSYEINQLFLYINSYLALYKDSIEKYDELTQVIYAKKHRFIGQKKHTLSQWYELYLALKDDIQYLSDYCDEELDCASCYGHCDKLFSFLFRIKPWYKASRRFVVVLTLGIALGFLDAEYVL